MAERAERIEATDSVDLDMAYELCGLLNIDELIVGLDQAEDVANIAGYISVILRANRKVGQKLWKRLDKKKFASKVSQGKDITKGTKSVKIINSTDPNMANKFCDLLNIEHLLTNLDQTKDLSDVGSCISAVLVANSKVGRKLWGRCKESLALKLSQPDDIWEGLLFFEDVYSCDPDMAVELCNLLNLELLGDALNQSEELSHIGHYIFAVSNVNSQVGQKLWQRCKKSLAAKLNRCRNILDVSSCIEKVFSCGTNVTQELFDLLNLEFLEDALNQTENLSDIGECIFKICKMNEQVGRKLWDDCKENLAIKLSQAKDFWTGKLCIDNIYSADPDMALELCSLVDIQEFAAGLNKADDVTDMGECISSFFRASSQLGQKLWALFDKEKLAVELSRSSVMAERAECIEAIYSVDSDMARELCGLLNIDALVADLDQADDVSDIGEDISAILKANLEVGVKLWQLYKKNLADKLNRTGKIRKASTCILKICSTDADMAYELCCLLNLEELGLILRETSDVVGRVEYLEVIGKANEEVHQKLLKFFEDENEEDEVE